MLFLPLAPREENSQSFPAATHCPSHERQSPASMGSFHDLQFSQRWTTPAQASSESRLPVGSVLCSSVGSFTGCRWDSSPPLISEGCRGSACHLAVCRRGRAALVCLPASFLSDLGVYMVAFLCSSPPKQKSSQKNSHRFSPLKCVSAEVPIGLALASGGSNLELREGGTSQSFL